MANLCAKKYLVAHVCWSYLNWNVLEVLFSTWLCIIVYDFWYVFVYKNQSSSMSKMLSTVCQLRSWRHLPSRCRSTVQRWRNVTLLMPLLNIVNDEMSAAFSRLLQMPPRRWSWNGWSRFLHISKRLCCLSGDSPGLLVAVMRISQPASCDKQLRHNGHADYMLKFATPTEYCPTGVHSLLMSQMQSEQLLPSFLRWVHWHWLLITCTSDMLLVSMPQFVYMNCTATLAVTASQ